MTNDTKYNADVHKSLRIIKEYNAGQEKLDEAPYGAWASAKDALRSKVSGPLGLGRDGADRAAGRREAGQLANTINRQWQKYLGSQGTEPKDAKPQQLKDFVAQYYSNADFDAIVKQLSPAGAILKQFQDNPSTPVSTDQQNQILMGIAQATYKAPSAASPGSKPLSKAEVDAVQKAAQAGNFTDVLNQLTQWKKDGRF